MPIPSDQPLPPILERFVQKWTGVFADNQYQNIHEGTFRNLVQEMCYALGQPEGGGGAAFTLSDITEFRDRFPQNFTGTPQQFITKLLKTYQAPGWASFLLQGAGSQTVEVGTVFGAGFKSFTWSLSNAGNVRANSIAVRDVTANTVLAGGQANTGRLSAATAAFTVGPGLSRVYLISAVNSEGSTISAELSISGLYKSYLGYVAGNGPLSVAQLVALGSGQLQSGKARTVGGVTAGAGLYTVYAWASSGSDDIAQVLLDGADSIRGAFGAVRYAQGPNALGAPVTMGYLISNAEKAFTGATLAFN